MRIQKNVKSNKSLHALTMKKVQSKLMGSSFGGGRGSLNGRGRSSGSEALKKGKPVNGEVTCTTLRDHY